MPLESPTLAVNSLRPIVSTLTQVDPLRELKNKMMKKEMLKSNLPVSRIMLHAFNFFLGYLECFVQGIEYFLRCWIILAEIVRAQLFFHLIFHVEWQSVLQKSTNFSAILTVTITNWKEMAMFQAHDMRRCNVRILVCLVWIVGGNATFGREWKFCDNVTYFCFACLRLVFATSGGGIILRLAVSCFVTLNFFSLLWIWFLSVILRNLLQIVI